MAGGPFLRQDEQARPAYVFPAGYKCHPHPRFDIILMASNPNYVKKQLAVDTVSWTAIVAPIDCMGVAIKNSVLVDLRIRTDSADATTQDTISAGSVETISVPRHPAGVQDGGSGTRFYAGDTIAFLQAVSGTGPAQLTFVR